jgi:hypothetical protein
MKTHVGRNIVGKLSKKFTNDILTLKGKWITNKTVQGIVIPRMAEFGTIRIWSDENFKPPQCQKLWGLYIYIYIYNIFIVLLFLFIPILKIYVCYLLFAIYLFMYLMCCISRFLWFLSFLFFSIFYYDIYFFYVFLLHFLCFCFFWSLVMVFCGYCARVTIQYFVFKK